MTQQSQTSSATKSALDIPFSAMLKSANEKAGQEKGLPAGATMRETLPAYYRTVKMVGDHPDAIGFSVYEHKKMNAEDGEEHKTDLPKPIKKGSIEYIEKSSIRDLIEGDHIAKRWRDEPEGSAPGDELEDEIANGVFRNELNRRVKFVQDHNLPLQNNSWVADDVRNDLTPTEIKSTTVENLGSIPAAAGKRYAKVDYGRTDDASINDAIDQMQQDPNNDRLNAKTVGSHTAPSRIINTKTNEDLVPPEMLKRGE